jgi:alkylated DNA repair dioxygenase AlkB
MSQTSLHRFLTKRKSENDSDDSPTRKKAITSPDELSLEACNQKNKTVIKTRGLDAVYMERFLPKSIATEIYTHCTRELTFYKPTYYDSKTESVSQSSRFMTYFRTNTSDTPFPPILEQLRLVLQQATEAEYNFVLVNLYMFDSDHIAYHRDRECRGTTIASISLGGTRDFVVRRLDNHNDKKKFALANGDLFVMKGTTQDTWEHAVPKRSVSSIYYPRINLTFRTMPDTSQVKEYGTSLRDGEPFRVRNDKIVSVAKEMNWRPLT